MAVMERVETVWSGSGWCGGRDGLEGLACLLIGIGCDAVVEAEADEGLIGGATGESTADAVDGEPTTEIVAKVVHEHVVGIAEGRPGRDRYLHLRVLAA